MVATFEKHRLFLNKNKKPQTTADVRLILKRDATSQVAVLINQ